MKEYVTNLSHEKSVLESNLNALQTESVGLKEEIKVLKEKTFHIVQERELTEMKHAKATEQLLLDKDILQREAEKVQSQLKSEVTKLQGNYTGCSLYAIYYVQCSIN